MRLLVIMCIVILVCYCFLSACGAALSSSHWTTKQVVDVFRNARLSVEDVHVPAVGEGLPAINGTEAVAFRVTYSTDTATGYIFSLTSAAAAEQLKQSALSVPQAATSNFASLTFTHDNIYVMLFGSISEAALREYEEAAKTLK